MPSRTTPEPSPAPITMASLPPVAGKLTARRHLRARGVARIAILALCISVLGGALAQVALAEEALPDGRVYEKVTPTSNRDADVYVPRANEKSTSQGVQTFFPFQVAADGSAVTYTGDASLGGEGEVGNGLGDQYLARRVPGVGWVQSVIQPDGHRKTHFQGFSDDLALGALTAGSAGEPLAPPLTAGAPAGGYAVLYTRNDFAQGGLEESLFAPLFTDRVVFNRSALGFGSTSQVEDEARRGQVPVFAGGFGGFGGFLLDGGVGGAFFEANDDVTPPGDVLRPGLDARIKAEMVAGEEREYLYTSVEGESSLVDRLPGGGVAVGATFGGLPTGNPKVNPPDFDGAVGDGRWVYWTDEASGGVFVRSGGVSVPVSSGAAQYWTSADGGRYAFYVEGGRLFRYDAVGGSREALTPGGVGVQGVLGASEDGESVYLVANGILPGTSSSGEGALPVEEPGVVNLYLLKQGQAPVFVTTVSQADGSEAQPMSSTVLGRADEGLFGDWQAGLGHRTAGVSAGGGSVVFMSDLSLPVVGFPHGDSGGADEVYLFQAGVNRLFCVSCSSSGEAGSGAFLPVSWNDVHLPEWLADGGNRVFFDSEAPLVAQDTNGRQDVYEWEREGTGSCVVGSGVNGGCVSLLSGGTSEADSWFIGASESGDDVFIATRANLTPEANNDAFKLFDARVGGVQPVTAPACTGTGCQGPPEPAPTFATPSSATFEGPGNFPPSPSNKTVVASTKKSVKCKKGFTEKRAKCIKVKAKKKAKKSNRRAK